MGHDNLFNSLAWLQLKEKSNTRCKHEVNIIFHAWGCFENVISLVTTLYYEFCVSFPELLRLYNEDCRQWTKYIGSQYGWRSIWSRSSRKKRLEHLSIKVEVLVSASKTRFEVVIYIISNQSGIICPNYKIVKLIWAFNIIAVAKVFTNTECSSTVITTKLKY